MPLERARIETQNGLKFRLIDGGDLGTMLQTLDGDIWKDWYSFDMEHVWPIDIEMSNYSPRLIPMPSLPGHASPSGPSPLEIRL